MPFSITGLPLHEFEPLFQLDDAELASRGVLRQTVEGKPGYPCRITLEDAEPDESVLLLNYLHQPTDSPFRSSHAIYVREGASEQRQVHDEVPGALRGRTIALRAFDDAGMMIGAEMVAPDGELKPAIERGLAEPRVAYLHAHSAGHGCYLARIDRA